MDRAKQLHQKFTAKAQLQRKLDAVLLVIEKVNKETSELLNGKIDRVTVKIKNELADND